MNEIETKKPSQGGAGRSGIPKPLTISPADPSGSIDRKNGRRSPIRETQKTQEMKASINIMSNNHSHQIPKFDGYHHGHLSRFGSRRLPSSHPNPKLLSSDSNIRRLMQADPSEMNETMRTNSAFLFDKLFPDQDAIVCMGPNPIKMTTNFRRMFDLKKSRPSMVVPTYMTALEGLTSDYPNGQGVQKISCRCLANTGDARFVVYCSHDISLEDQAYRIIRLALEAPLVMVVLTPMGWLNAWYSVIGWSKRDVARMRLRARIFNSWPKTGIACHPYPFPGGRHNFISGYEGGQPIVIWTNEVHRAVYFDPAAIGTAIPNYR